ncbi:winged helix-turn-helix domain-containing protein [Thiotrichales bacterium 19X7-9]|nr:winged helix-turn-helix domain-containing protein [Thiotrichales bacterium 19X7-9]
MTLKLSDLLKKAEDKGLVKSDNSSSKKELIKPWQRESVIFKDEAEELNTESPSQSKSAQNKLGTNTPTSGNKVGTELGTNTPISGNKVGTELGTNTPTSGNKVGTELGTNTSTSGNKVGTELGTNTSTSGNKVGTELGTNTPTSGNKVGTELGTNTPTSGNKIGTELGTKIGTKIGTKVGTINNKNRDILFSRIQLLEGVQLHIFDYIIGNMRNSNKEYYAHINTTDLADKLSVSKDVCRVSLKRLVSKGIIIRDTGIVGRYGFSIFKIPSNSVKYYGEIKSKHIRNDTGNKNRNDIGNNAFPINNKENKDYFITSNENQNSTKGWWSDIDLSPLEEFGMTKLKFESAVKNRETTFEPEAIQESIYHYAYTIEHFPEKVERYKNSNGGILSGLLGMLRKGSVWVEDNYRSAEEEALEKKLKVEREKLKRIKEQKEEMFKLQFEVWHESLSDEELKKVQKEVKGKTSGKTSGAMYDAALKAYYKQHIHTPK